MTVRPYGEDYMSPAWIGLLVFSAQNDEALASFKAETGYDLRAVLTAGGLMQQIDKATGYDLTVIGAFGDWLTTNIWGIEGQEGEPQ